MYTYICNMYVCIYIYIYICKVGMRVHTLRPSSCACSWSPGFGTIDHIRYYTIPYYTILYYTIL